MLSLVSLASKSGGMTEYLKTSGEHEEMKDVNFVQGDVVETIITCANGSIISLKLDTTLPTPYSREFSVEGTKGFYLEQGNIVYEDKRKLDKGEELTIISIRRKNMTHIFPKYGKN